MKRQWCLTVLRGTGVPWHSVGANVGVGWSSSKAVGRKQGGGGGGVRANPLHCGFHGKEW